MRDDLDRRLPFRGRFSDLTGKQFGKLRVVGFAGFLRRYASWLCECECGTALIVRQNSLGPGKANSCGCARRKHGLARTKLYQIHQNIIQRCENCGGCLFQRYGGRGVRICRGWRHDVESFVRDMGPRPSDEHSVDRVDNNGNYSCGHCDECLANGWPMNCRWATQREQAHNSRRARWITHDGERLCLREWGRRIGITCERMRKRVNACLRRGVDISEAITTPPGETMPSFRDAIERHRLQLARERAEMVKDDWFNGEVHVIVQGKHWPKHIAASTYRNIINSEAESRGGKCKCRMLNNHLMFVFKKKEAGVA